jgi:hypothetical protein
MKYEAQVESIFNKFIQNTVCGKQLNEYQLTAVKNYFQKCWETGYAQGYADSIYENQSQDNDLDNTDNTRANDTWMDDVLDLSNN